MDIRVFDTAEDVAAADAVAARPDVVLGLPTGRTPVPTYAALRRLHHAGNVNFARTTTSRARNW